jgi:hypothetical protein
MSRGGEKRSGIKNRMQSSGHDSLRHKQTSLVWYAGFAEDTALTSTGEGRNDSWNSCMSNCCCAGVWRCVSRPHTSAHACRSGQNNRPADAAPKSYKTFSRRYVNNVHEHVHCIIHANQMWTRNVNTETCQEGASSADGAHLQLHAPACIIPWVAFRCINKRCCSTHSSAQTEIVPVKLLKLVRDHRTVPLDHQQMKVEPGADLMVPRPMRSAGYSETGGCRLVHDSLQAHPARHWMQTYSLQRSAPNGRSCQKVLTWQSTGSLPCLCWSLMPDTPGIPLAYGMHSRCDVLGKGISGSLALPVSSAPARKQPLIGALQDWAAPALHLVGRCWR